MGVVIPAKPDGGGLLFGIDRSSIAKSEKIPAK